MDEIQELRKELRREIQKVKFQARVTFTLAMLVGGSLGFTQMQSVRANGRGTTVTAPFVVVDEQGKRLLNVFSTVNGAVFQIYNDRENLAAMISTAPDNGLGDGTHLTLWTRDPQFPVVDLGARAKGGALNLRRTDGKDRIILHAGNDLGAAGNPTTFELRDKAGRTAFAVHANKGGRFILLNEDDIIFEKP